MLIHPIGRPFAFARYRTAMLHLVCRSMSEKRVDMIVPPCNGRPISPTSSRPSSWASRGCVPAVRRLAAAARHGTHLPLPSGTCMCRNVRTCPLSLGQTAVAPSDTTTQRIASPRGFVLRREVTGVWGRGCGGGGGGGLSSTQVRAWVLEEGRGQAGGRGLHGVCEDGIRSVRVITVGRGEYCGGAEQPSRRGERGCMVCVL
ncbi:hypothetical protein DFH27DRAFT_350098 [Peziza echinospora]|nr:hypothetical protein DFH27DRAFT_350098 [Peziza echinospora]